MRIRILTKKRVTICAILVFSLVFLSGIANSEEGEDFKLKLSIKINWGLRYMSVGDINTHLESLDNYISHRTFYEGGKTKGINNYGTDFEGELRLDISSKFAISVGIAYMSGKSRSDFETVGSFPLQMPMIGPFYWHKFFSESKVKTIPLKFGIYYTLPISSRINLFINSGLGYYFSKASLDKTHVPLPLEGYGIDDSRYHVYDVSSNGLGFHGGVGFEYNIANFFGLVIEVQTRYARIKNLKGKRLYCSWFGPRMEEEGILYIGERDLTDEGYGENCPDLIISQSKPNGDEYRNIREAVLDFSGLSLRVGIRIKLF